MSESSTPQFPLYEALHDCPPPLTRMKEYLRDDGRKWEEVEQRRKTDLKKELEGLKKGKHPLLVLLAALQAVLGHEHPIGHLATAAADPQSYAHLFKGKSAAPEELELKRIESLAQEKLMPEFHQAHITPDPGLLQWIERLEASFDRRSAVDITESIVERLMQQDAWRGSKYGKQAVLVQLQNLRRNEAIDNLVHPNDPHIDDDFYQELLDYKPRITSAEHDTRDEYQTPDDIEVRRSMEIVRILKDWKRGANPLIVMADILDTAFPIYRSPFPDVFSKLQKNKKQERESRKESVSTNAQEDLSRENVLVYTLREKASISREIRQIARAMREEVMAYKDPETNPEFAGQIDAFIAHVEITDESSLSVIQGIAEAIFAPVKEELKEPVLPDSIFDLDDFDDDVVSMRDRPLLSQIRLRIKSLAAEEEEKAKASKPMGMLKTQTEEETREPLSEIFRRRAKAKKRDSYQPLPKLTSEIHIDPSGSGMIRPFPKGEYYDGFEENLYGTTTARITTYSIGFVPKNPDDTLKLAGYVRWALKRIADTTPAFEVTTDRTSDPYKRPAFGREWFSDKPGYQNTHVTITNEGRVQPTARLDLDDVWLLYYLLEDVIEPSEQIAAAMNAARYAEERGPLLQKADMGTPYSNSNMRPEEQMGSLDEEDPEEYVSAMMQHTLALYALGEIDEEQFLQRMLVLADHTLTGRMVDPYGVLPTFNRIADQSKTTGGGAVMTYDDALKERARELLMIMTGMKNSDQPLFPALIKKVAEIARPLRNHLRDVAKQEQQRFWDEWETRMRSYAKTDWKKQWGEMLKGMGGKEDVQNDTCNKAEDSEQEKRNVAYRANIALRDSDVGATTDRTWRGTDYVSRSRNSLWVRKDLPAALLPFTRRNARPDMGNMLKLITG